MKQLTDVVLFSVYLTIFILCLMLNPVISIISFLIGSLIVYEVSIYSANKQELEKSRVFKNANDLKSFSDIYKLGVLVGSEVYWIECEESHCLAFYLKSEPTFVLIELYDDEFVEILEGSIPIEKIFYEKDRIGVLEKHDDSIEFLSFLDFLRNGNSIPSIKFPKDLTSSGHEIIKLYKEIS